MKHQPRSYARHHLSSGTCLSRRRPSARRWIRIRCRRLDTQGLGWEGKPHGAGGPQCATALRSAARRQLLSADPGPCGCSKPRIREPGVAHESRAGQGLGTMLGGVHDYEEARLFTRPRGVLSQVRANASGPLTCMWHAARSVGRGRHRNSRAHAPQRQRGAGRRQVHRARPEGTVSNPGPPQPAGSTHPDPPVCLPCTRYSLASPPRLSRHGNTTHGGAQRALRGAREHAVALQTIRMIPRMIRRTVRMDEHRPGRDQVQCRLPYRRRLRPDPRQTQDDDIAVRDGRRSRGKWSARC